MRALGAFQEPPDLRKPRRRVRLADLDQPPHVVALEHHQAQHVVRLRLTRAEPTCQETKRARQLRFEVVRQPPEVLRRTQHQQIDVPQPRALLLPRQP